MNGPKIFCVDWPTGHIKVNVGNLFGRSNKREINKFLKLARTYCTNDQKAVLLADLEDEKRVRAEAVSAMANLRSHMQ